VNAPGPLARAVDASLWLGIGLGVCARLVRYFDARSLWGDEAQLALNLMNRDAAALLGSLDMGQSAPYGFLLLERAVIESFGAGELALRALPLLASLGAFPLFAYVARRVLVPRDALIALFLFATSEPLIFYASELKQYAFDVAVVLGLFGLALRAASEVGAERGTLAGLAIAGATSVWFSHPAAFALGAIGALLFANAWQREQLSGSMLVQWGGLAALWIGSFALSFGMQGNAALADPYLQRFWADAFAPFPPLNAADLFWYPRTLLGFFADPLGMPPAGLALLAACAGALRFARTRPLWLVLLLGAPLLALLASMAGLFPLRTWPGVDIRDRLFPFVGRLWLFAVPLALLLVAAGVGWLRDRGDELGEWLALAALLLVSGLSLRQAAVNAFDPPKIQEFRPVAVQMAEEMESGDHLWIQRGSEPVFEYYARQLGLQVSARNVAALEPEQRLAFERDVAALTPADRVWLVSLSHPAWQTAENSAALTRGLEARATREFELSAPGASAILFSVRD